jgi:prepilin-type N-terminal cleavage/methylation domain-containing protein
VAQSIGVGLARKAQELRFSGGRTLGCRQRGFSLTELMIAAVVFLVGIAAVMQLVPAAMQSNLQNRVDTTSVVTAQRELDQMTDQPLASNFFTDVDGNVCNLGNAATPNVVVGSPLVQVGNFVRIDFAAARVNGYNFQFTNPQNPTDGSYDVRWAVITAVNGAGAAVSKRFIVGAQRRVGPQVLFPVSLDSWQQLVQ